ncbi:MULTISPECIES: NIL domain-containing protein [unclassified Nostoc]|uniref:NIL domain-containing protein n=1 Tax=unclassified Nostoc TaxID=2593658 RepID=UPI000B9593D5|nr:MULTISPECIES: NIL domain-containing protein [unclassified Nostoc]AVH67767.1 NIL domain-containing protein [Nostoc sp. 'Peltigera membranacea cyanobiont' N6]OYE06799.1 NIL domain-containing protein [Nostoc sp. 'Peltigera membranacea cyanobiont' 232]
MAIPNKEVKSNTDILDNRRTQTCIQVRIPKDLHEEPVISRLTSHYGVTVIIAAAQISVNVPECSCFDLELRGTISQIESALTYLDELDLEVLHQSSPEEDGW